MQTTKGPTADRERTGMTNADEIQELKACVEELQAQVLGAGRLAAMVADWAVAPQGQRCERYSAGILSAEGHGS